MTEPLRRALQLVEQGRLRDAQPHLRQAISEEPEDSQGYYLLACCLTDQPSNYREALQMINEAIRLDPNRAAYHAQKASILILLDRQREALQAAEESISLGPSSVEGFAARSAALIGLGRAQEAEQAARQALAIDPEHEPAANLLAHALRIQGRMIENAEQIESLLARNPENPHTHATAGWSALQRGQGRDAERHFLEALRLDPSDLHAREGLLEAFRARSPLYRAYLRYCFFMERLRPASRWLLIIGLLVLMRIARALFVGPLAPLAVAIVALYLLFVLWVWVARGVGNLMLLFDKFARHALARSEKLEAGFVGGGVVAGLALLAVGLPLEQFQIVLLALTLIAAAFPMSLVFTNPSKLGRIVFGSIGAAVYAGGLYAIAGASFPWFSESGAMTVFGFALILALLTTWIGNIPALRRA
jgi:tetratricopeptide (TPR) repeat protein